MSNKNPYSDRVKYYRDIQNLFIKMGNFFGIEYNGEKITDALTSVLFSKFDNKEIDIEDVESISIFYLSDLIEKLANVIPSNEFAGIKESATEIKSLLPKFHAYENSIKEMSDVNSSLLSDNKKIVEENKLEILNNKNLINDFTNENKKIINKINDEFKRIINLIDNINIKSISAELEKKQLEQTLRINDLQTEVESLGISFKEFKTKLDKNNSNKKIMLRGGDGFGSSLPIASATVLGGIKVGSGLTIDETGLLSASGGSPAGSNTEIQINVDGAFGSSSNFTYNKDTETLGVNSIASLTGNDLNLSSEQEAKLQNLIYGNSLVAGADGSISISSNNNADININSNAVMNLGASSFDINTSAGSYLKLFDDGNIEIQSQGTTYINSLNKNNVEITSQEYGNYITVWGDGDIHLQSANEKSIILDSALSVDITADSDNNINLNTSGDGTTIANSFRVSSSTTDTVAIFDGYNNLVSSSISTTKLGYLTDVTSNIQAQINNKFTLPSFTAGSVLFSNGSTIAQNNGQLYWNNTATSLGIGTSSTNGKLDILDTTLAGSGSLSGSVLNLAQTWNTTGNPTAIKLNITNTASGATSKLLDLQVGGISKVVVDKSGNVGIGTSTPSYKLDVQDTTSYGAGVYPIVASFLTPNTNASGGTIFKMGKDATHNGSFTWDNGTNALYFQTYANSYPFEFQGSNNIFNPSTASIFKIGGTEIARITSTGLGVGIGVSAGGARVDIIGSTTSYASLRIRSGVAPTSPNDGDAWYDGTNLYFRVGGTTKTFTLV